MKGKRLNTLECRNGLWFENGKILRKRDYILHCNCNDGTSMISCLTGSKYRLKRNTFVYHAR